MTRIGRVVVAIGLGLLVSGGRGVPDASAQAWTLPTEPVTIGYWDTGNGTKGELIKTLIAEYQKLHPNVTRLPRVPHKARHRGSEWRTRRALCPHPRSPNWCLPSARCRTVRLRRWNHDRRKRRKPVDLPGLLTESLHQSATKDTRRTAQATPSTPLDRK